MKSSELITEIKTFCLANADEKTVEKYKRYFKTGYDAYGVKWELFKERLLYLLKSPGLDFKTIIEASRILTVSPKYEEVTAAIFMFERHKKHFDKSVFNEISLWFNQGINNWAHTDTICSWLTKPLILKNIISLTDFEDWKSANNKFKRRAVPVSMLPLLKTDIEIHKLLSFIEPLMSDKEREVHQGVGWFLREAWKKHPIDIESFLMKYKETSARLIFQYACEKMSKDEKQKFKKA